MGRALSVRLGFIVTLGCVMSCFACADDRVGTEAPTGADRGPSRPAASLPAALPSPLASQPVDFVADSLCSSRVSTTEVELQAQTVLGFSASDVLARAVKPATLQPTTLHWAVRDGLELAPETGSKAFQIDVEPRGTHARIVDPEAGIIGHGLVCQTWLEIDVTIELRSEKGALAERVDATLYTQRVDAAYALLAVEGARLAGALRVHNRASDPVDPEPYSIELGLSFSDLGVSGTISSQWRSSATAAHSPGSTQLELAYIGSGRCSSSEHAVALETRVDGDGVSARAALDRLAAHDPLQIEWSDGTTTTTSFVFKPDSGACVHEGWGNTANPETTRGLTVPGTLSLSSTDGRLLGEYTTQLAVDLRAPSSEGPNFRISADGHQEAPVLPAKLGFPLMSGDGYSIMTLSLMLQAGAAIGGTVELIGYNDEPSTDDSGQIGALTPKVLEHGMFH